MDIVNELILFYDYRPEEATKIVLKYEKENKVDDLYALLGAKKDSMTFTDVQNGYSNNDVCLLQP